MKLHMNKVENRSRMPVMHLINDAVAVGFESVKKFPGKLKIA